MVLHLGISLIKSATLAAVAIPGIDWLTEALGESVGLNHIDATDALLDPGNITGGGQAIAGITKGVHDINEQFAKLAADVGNVIGVDHLSGAGEDKLTAWHFRENYGIIPKVISNVGGTAPDALGDALDENNRGVVAAGVGAGVLTTAMIPKLGEEVHYAVSSTANGALQLSNRALQSAQTGASAASGHVGKLMERRSAQIEAPVALSKA